MKQIQPFQLIGRQALKRADFTENTTITKIEWSKLPSPPLKDLE